MNPTSEFLPIAVPVAIAADAKTNWEDHCAKCHGAAGKGDTKTGQKLKVKDYSDPKVQADLKDDKACKAIKEGVKEKGSDKVKMKGFAETLNDDDVKALVTYFRTFKK